MQESLRGELEKIASRPSLEVWLQTVRARKEAAGSRVDTDTPSSRPATRTGSDRRHRRLRAGRRPRGLRERRRLGRRGHGKRTTTGARTHPRRDGEHSSTPGGIGRDHTTRGNERIPRSHAPDSPNEVPAYPSARREHGSHDAVPDGSSSEVDRGPPACLDSRPKPRPPSRIGSRPRGGRV